MTSRLELQTLLEEILGSENVYFQPPESLKMKYPAIIYNLDGFDNYHSNDNLYLSTRRYAITLVDANPDNLTVDKLMNLQYCRFDRQYQSDNLNHYVFTINF